MLSRKLTPSTFNFPKWKNEDMTSCERWYDCMWPHENMHLCLWKFLDVRNEELINGAESMQKKKNGTLRKHHMQMHLSVWQNVSIKARKAKQSRSELPVLLTPSPNTHYIHTLNMLQRSKRNKDERGKNWRERERENLQQHDRRGNSWEEFIQ